jgi:electron transfer flavoprotein alpha subunit
VTAIVLVKQVPDLRAAPVGVGPDGTIARDAAEAITNPADLHALEAALQLADEVVVLTMGPPRSEEVLRDAIGRGADRGVLLVDRALAGSDTWATANALAAAVEHLGGADLILTGLSAIDGETGQVGPQLATRLGLPQATGCEALEPDGDHLIARRIVEGGYERLRLPLPAVVTVAETGFVPRYPTLPGRRRAAQSELERLTADDVGLGRDRVGLEASPTKVAHMTPAPLPDRGCRMVSDGFDLDDLLGELVSLGALATPQVAATSSGPGADPAPVEPTTDRPAIWVVCEIDDTGELTRVAAELLTKACELAPALGGGVGAFCAAAEPDRAATEAARFGADVVYVARHDELTPYRAQPHARVLAEALQAAAPAAVLFGATTTGRDLAPRVAASLDAGLAADCTDLTVGPWTRRGITYDALLHQVRPAMAGGVLATCVAPTARPQMATVRPGTFEPRPRPTRHHVVEVAVTLQPGDIAVEVLDREVRSSEVHLADAEVIVAGGAGCDARSWHLVEDLSSAIGGSVAATRGAVEAGLAPRSLQVGQTGTTVHPRLYVACGVSGALQHIVGMRAARTVVAVNRDPDALIFRVADFGIVGDVGEVLPALTEALRRR